MVGGGGQSDPRAGLVGNCEELVPGEGDGDKEVCAVQRTAESTVQ